MEDGFLLRRLDRGLSKVEIVVPEAKDGVRMAGGGRISIRGGSRRPFVVDGCSDECATGRF